MRNPIQPLILEKLPSFIKSEYPNLFRVLSDFYQWLEDDNFLQLLSDYAENSEINSEIDPYIDLIMKELGWDYSITTPGDKKAVANTLRDFYLSKGNKYSFDYLFRALFNSTTEIDYPRKRLLVPSAAEYYGDFYVLATANNIGSDQYKYVTEAGGSSDLTIRGYVSEQVENITRITPIIYQEVQHLLISIDGPANFMPFETIRIGNPEGWIIEQIINTVQVSKIYSPGSGYKKGDFIDISGPKIKGVARVKRITKGSIIGVNVINPGFGYKVGDPVVIEKGGSNGYGFYSSVSSVGPDGEIESIIVHNGGSEFEEIPPLVVRGSSGTGAVLSVVPYEIGGIKEVEFTDPYWGVGDGVGAIPPVYYDIYSNGSGADIDFNSDSCVFNEAPKFRNDQGVLGINGISHDSLYFQEYSYEISTDVPPKLYRSIIQESVHPAGLVRYLIFNHTANLNYSFNRLDHVKFLLFGVEIERFLGLTFDSEEKYQNLVSFVERIPDILSRHYSDNEMTSSLRTGLAVVRYQCGHFSSTRLSAQDRIPNHFVWETTCENVSLETGISFIRQYDAGQEMFSSVYQTFYGINSGAINETKIG